MAIPKNFPFNVIAYFGSDGVPVVEIETGDALPEFHKDDVPTLRVYVNDDLVSGDPIDLTSFEEQL